MTDYDAARAALKSVEDALLTSAREADEAQAALAGARRDAASHEAALKAELADARKKIAVLEGKLVTPRAMLVGGSIADPKLGQLAVQRTFSPDVPGTRPKRDGVIVHSYKRGTPAQREAWLVSAINRDALGYHHEPEDDIEKGTLKPADYVRGAIALCESIRDGGHIGRKRPHLTFMQWSLNPASKREKLMASLLTEDVLAAMRETQGVLGWDVYSDQKNGAPLRTAEGMYGPPARRSAELGLPWAVSETGAKQDGTTNGKAHAEFWTEVFAYLRSDAVPTPEWFCAWNRVDFAGTFSFDVAAVPEVLAVWKREVAASVTANR